MLVSLGAPNNQKLPVFRRDTEVNCIPVVRVNEECVENHHGAMARCRSSLTHLLACMADVVMKNGAHTKPYFQRCVSRSEPTGSNLCQWRTASSVSASIGCDKKALKLKSLFPPWSISKKNPSWSCHSGSRAPEKCMAFGRLLSFWEGLFLGLCFFWGKVYSKKSL